MVPDICYKLLKRAYGPNQTLHTLFQRAQTVYYGRENKEMKESQKRTREQAVALAMGMKTILKQPEKNAQRDLGEKNGLAIIVERGGTSSEVALRHPSHPWLHVWSTRGHTGRDGPQRHRLQVSESQDNQD